MFAEAVLTSTHNLCFEQKYEKYQSFLSEIFQYFEVKFSIYLNRHVFEMMCFLLPKDSFVQNLLSISQTLITQTTA